MKSAIGARSGETSREQQKIKQFFSHAVFILEYAHISSSLLRVCATVTIGNLKFYRVFECDEE